MPRRGKFVPSQHPRIPKGLKGAGRFTDSGSVELDGPGRARAQQIAAAIKPKRGVTGPKAADYLSGIGGRRQRPGSVEEFFTDEKAFDDVQQALRSGEETPAVGELDAAMVDLPDDLLVSRRVPAAMFGNVDPASLVGFQVHDAAFFPASLTLAKGTAGDVRMRIAVPKGTRAVVNPDTGELVLERGLEMAVTRAEPNSQGGIDMYLVAMPEGAEVGRPRSERDEEAAAPADTARPGQETAQRSDDAAPTTAVPTSRADEADADAALRAELMRLRVAELQARARERGLRPGKARKSALVDMILADERGDEPAGTDDRVDAEWPAAPNASDRDYFDGALTVNGQPIGESLTGFVPESTLDDRGRRATQLWAEEQYADPLAAALRDPERPPASRDIVGSNGTVNAAELAADLDHAVAQGRISQDTMLWRGVVLPRGRGEELYQPGAELSDPSFLPASFRRRNAEEMADYRTRGRFDGSERWLMRMLVPAGTPAAPGAQSVAEAILGRDTKLTVLGREPGADGQPGIVTVGVAPAAPVSDAVGSAVRPSAVATPERRATRTRRPRTGKNALTAAGARLSDRKGTLDTDATLTFASEPEGWSPAAREASARAMRLYRNSTFREINAFLRDPDNADRSVSIREDRDMPPVQEDLNQHVALVDQAMEASPLAAPVTLWRGIAKPEKIFGDAWQPDGDMTGAEWTEDAFLSTSADRGIASAFGFGAPLLRLHVPAGTGAVQLDSWKTGKRPNAEAELLLERGLRMRVIGDSEEQLGTTTQWERQPDGSEKMVQRPYARRVLDVEVTPTLSDEDEEGPDAAADTAAGGQRAAASPDVGPGTDDDGLSDQGDQAAGQPDAARRAGSGAAGRLTQPSRVPPGDEGPSADDFSAALATAHAERMRRDAEQTVRDEGAREIEDEAATYRADGDEEAATATERLADQFRRGLLTPDEAADELGLIGQQARERQANTASAAGPQIVGDTGGETEPEATPPAMGDEALAAAPIAMGKYDFDRGVDADLLEQVDPDALGIYRSEEYRRINGALRAGALPKDFEHDWVVATIDAVMKRSRLTRPVRVQRGILSLEHLLGFDTSKSLTGMEFDELGYSSTTADPAVADGFTNINGAILDITVPAGVGAIQLSDYVAEPEGPTRDVTEEAELVLERGLRYRITGDRVVDGVRRLEAEVVVDDRPSAAATLGPTAVSGVMSNKPLLPNTWGGAAGVIHYHEDGPIGRAVAGLGADARMEVDGDALANVLGRLATDVVLSRRTAQQGLDALKALRDRLPEDSRARRALGVAIDETDAPDSPVPVVPGGTPEPLRQLMVDLHAIPIVRRTGRGPAGTPNRRETDQLAQLLDDFAAGRISGLRLIAAVRAIGNQRHESLGDSGRLEIDQAVTRAVDALEAMRRANRQSLMPPTATTPTSPAPAQTPTGPYEGPRFELPTDADLADVATLRAKLRIAHPEGWYQGDATRQLEDRSDDTELRQLVKRLGPTVVSRIAWETDAESAMARLIQIQRPPDPSLGPTDAIPPVTDAEITKIKADATAQLRRDFAGKKIATRVTAGALKQILEDGRFKTQFETQRSGGGYAPKKRAAVERTMFGLPINADPKRRPIYGYLVMDEGQPAHDRDSLDAYGEVQVVFKDAIRRRTTATVGDSLDDQVLPSPVDEPSWESFNSVAHWRKGMQLDYGSERPVLYVEAQIHDGVGVDDIAEVLFRTAPSAQLKKQLEQSGVAWRVLGGS